MEIGTTTSSSTKTCLECGIRISGRSDKKFCADSCRIAFNNRLHSQENNFVRNVNNTLRRNRKILASLNPKGTSKIDAEILRELGFDFRYMTHEMKLRGHDFRFCYEFGYTRLDERSCWIIKTKEQHRTVR